MKLLSDAREGSLFQVDFTFLSEVFYKKVSSDFALLILPEKPEGELPQEVLLVPETGEARSTVYQCRLAKQPEEYRAGPLERAYYVVEAVLGKGPELRDELRVNTSFRIRALFDGPRGAVNLTASDLSAGGMMFVSKEAFVTGETFMFAFTPAGGRDFVTARIVKVRPTRDPEVHAYSCRFFRLAPKTEAAIRRFVFSQEVSQERERKKGEER